MARRFGTYVNRDFYVPLHEHKKLQEDHQQYVEWASPQLERLGREMAENEQLKTALRKADDLLMRGLPILALAKIRGALHPKENC